MNIKDNMISKKIAHRETLIYKYLRKYISRYFLRQQYLHRKNLTVGIEIINICNLNCIFCPQNEIDMRRGVTPDKVIDKVLNELKTLKGYKFRFEIGGMGEPFLHPNILQVIRKVKAAFPTAYRTITTNATVLPRKIALEIINKSLLDNIGFSLNVLTKEDYELIMGVDLYNQVYSNIINFIKLRNNLDSDITVNICVKDLKNLKITPEKVHEVFKDLLKPGDKTWVNTLNNWGGLIPVSEFSNSYFPVPNFPCLSLWNNIIFDKDGNVYPCCCSAGTTRERSKLLLGNIFKVPLKDCLTKLNNIRKIHLRGERYKISECRCCSMSEQNMFYRNPLYKILSEYKYF